jgi:hypothetical protein
MNQALYAHMNNKRKMKKKILDKNNLGDISLPLFLAPAGTFREKATKVLSVEINFIFCRQNINLSYKISPYWVALIYFVCHNSSSFSV